MQNRSGNASKNNKQKRSNRDNDGIFILPCGSIFSFYCVPFQSDDSRVLLRLICSVCSPRSNRVFAKHIMRVQITIIATDKTDHQGEVMLMLTLCHGNICSTPYGLQCITFNGNCNAGRHVTVMVGRVNPTVQSIVIVKRMHIRANHTAWFVRPKG